MALFKRKKITDKEWEEMNSLVIETLKSGDLDKALTYAHNLYEITKKNYGNSHDNTATAVNNLGFIYMLRKEFSKAESYLLLSLEITEKVHGKYSKEVAVVNANLSKLYLLRAKESCEIDNVANYNYEKNSSGGAL